ncbi:MAG: hypothetical protein ACKVOY_09155 [Burkholderiaceae bacterium]
MTNTAFATDTAAIHNHLTIAAIDQQKGLFNVRELHDMGSSGVQQIDYVVNCSNQTLALAGFAVMTSKGRLTSNAPAATSATHSFYKPVIEHDQRITSKVCKNLVTMSTAVSQ